jgi:hypothetical protein
MLVSEVTAQLGSQIASSQSLLSNDKSLKMMARSLRTAPHKIDEDENPPSSLITPLWARHPGKARA